MGPPPTFRDVKDATVSDMNALVSRMVGGPYNAIDSFAIPEITKSNTIRIEKYMTL